MGNNIENNYREEVQNGDYPDSLSTEQMKQALFQMENSICKIIVDEKGEKLGTGFFCKIPFPNEFHLLPVLITCNHVLDSSSIAKGKIIKFSFNKKLYSILIDESRKCLSDKVNDFTIIEIKKNDFYI